LWTRHADVRTLERAVWRSATETESTRGFAPFFLVGGGYRVRKRLVLGLTACVTGGVGGSYNDVEEVGGEDLDLSVALGELSLPISVRALDGLSFGLAFRPDGTKLDSDSERFLPHSLQVGSALSLVGDALLLTLDLSFQFYDQSHNTVTTTLDIPPDGVEQTMTLSWQNTVTANSARSTAFRSC